MRREKKFWLSLGEDNPMSEVLDTWRMGTIVWKNKTGSQKAISSMTIKSAPTPLVVCKTKA
jgi:hypothetical protein